MRVTAVVVAWNSEALLEGCVASLLRQDVHLDVVVVDNASVDGSLELAQAIAGASDGRVRVIANPVNRGFSGGVNTALAVVDADAVLLVNPDVRLEPDHVGHLVAALEADPALGSVQGTLWRPSRAGQPERIDSTGHRAFRTRLFGNRDEGAVRPSDGGTVFGVTGAAALHRRAMLDDVAHVRPDGSREWLDETLFAYFDDVDLDWRARLRGWRAAHVPQAVGRHQRGGAGPRRTLLVEELNAANRLLVVLKLDEAGALRRSLGPVVVGTVLKTAWLAVRHPTVVPRAVRRFLRGRPVMLERRAEVFGRAVVDPAEVAGSFESFAWRPWVRRWWERVTGRSPV